VSSSAEVRLLSVRKRLQVEAQGVRFVNRLTSSQPNRMGGFWRLQPVPVLSGFETFFRFQV
jgi:hypothetical protein